MMNGKDDLLQALQRASLRKITVAGREVYVRGLNGSERSLVRQRQIDKVPLEDFELAALCLCDEAGTALYTTEQMAAVDGAELETIAREVLKASRMIGEDDAAKNSEATRSG